MSYSPASPILNANPPRINTQALAAHANRLGGDQAEQTREYVDAVVNGAIRLGIDPVVLLAQWVLETDWSRSEPWIRNLNAAGIGWTGDPVQNAASQKWQTGTDSAYAHIAHIASYLWGSETFARWPDTWPDVLEIDRRFPVPIAAGYRAVTLADLTNTWAIDNGYADKLASRANGIVRDFGTEITTGEEQEPMAITFGRVPHPPHRKEIANKGAPGQGYDLVPPRQNVGMTWHEWMGYYIPGFFSCPSGERCRNALVDYAILKDGTIIMINDPRGTRSPWASGGGVGLPGGLEGDGPAFVSKFGVGAINARTVSVEIVKLDHEDYTQAQIQAAGALAAYWHDQDEQLWSEHPFTSKYGIVTSFLHFEFGTTSCGKGELDDIAKVQAVTKGIMRQYQEGGTGEPETPQVPEQPDPAIPGGLTLSEAQKRFGHATRHKDGKSTGGLGFDRRGPISLAWAHRAAVEQEWPQIEDWYVLKDSGEVFQIVTFSNDWRLVQVAERSGWQWLDFVPVMVAAA